MSLTYDAENRLKALSPILDEYSEWFGRVFRRAFYPGDSRTKGSSLKQPNSLGLWIEDPKATDFVDEGSLDKIRGISGELHEAARLLMDRGSETGGAPGVELVDNFVDLHDEFVAHIRRLERDSLLADSGLDSLTGLRTQEVMAKDIRREMERRSRRGKPFCLVLGRIDDFGPIRAANVSEAVDHLIVQAASAIRECVRTYDDSYRLENGEFLMCLKHADIDGGLAAVDRIQRTLARDATTVRLDGGERFLTLSFVTAEPEHGEDAIELIAHLRADLDKISGERSVSLQYYEVSPLKRYIQSID